MYNKKIRAFFFIRLNYKSYDHLPDVDSSGGVSKKENGARRIYGSKPRVSGTGINRSC